MIRIRKGTTEDIDAIMDCYDTARQFMRKSGNRNQWINGYPSRELVERDIAQGVSYVGCDESRELVMAFAFIKGEDPTYTVWHYPPARIKRQTPGHSAPVRGLLFHADG